MAKKTKKTAPRRITCRVCGEPCRKALDGGKAHLRRMSKNGRKLKKPEHRAV